ncbi:pimeloyl-ACP methyl ester carboxylesterase [Streptosporangium album]|uniref:Pimeloyl-ACP methyl ester carboxylesterase n=1 Tax=Streptosporangium album TaxID=47479 RepID=A0A7W7S5C7_9ACTN|nr:epoxide hydrolase family protein [Streptosporangium album]MBB4944178.1 pimeloyl-ACP methyl ester carboxylesterase [Streptosporangium album]
MEVRPFRIDVAHDVLDDLRWRLERARPAAELPGAGWDYGTNGEYLAELVTYWRTRFDWRKVERRLNELPNVRVEVDGLDVHLVVQRGEGPDPLPIVLVHGWPSGYLEMTRLIPLLADPGAHGADQADAFHVVVPSLPGFGFSDAPRSRGYGYARMAATVRRVVTEGLGYRRYGLHGTGLGAYVNGRIALADPEAVVGLHTHDPALTLPLSAGSPRTEAEEAFLAYAREWNAEEGAYGALHRTKPQSLAHALNDSPVGLLSWLVEKYRSWSDCDEDVERRYSKDDLLTSATLYWVTGSIGSSIRVYYERVRADPPIPPGTRLRVPTGVAMPRAIPGNPPRRATREMIGRTHDIHHWVDLSSGGHFASWEEPELVAASIRDFFRPLR